MHTPASWPIRFVKLTGVNQLLRGQTEVEDDEEQRDDDRRVAEIARSDVEAEAVPVGLGLRLGRDGGRAHVAGPSPVPAMPDTLVGIPAVIAWTISSWLVFARS